MKITRKTVDLRRFAADAKADLMELDQPDHPTPDEHLRKLLANIGKTVILPVNWLVIRDNIRQMVDTASPDFAKLVESVRKYGVKQNLIGNVAVGEDGSWQIVCVAGQRRLLAAQQSGRETVPVRLERYTDKASHLVDALSENLLRKNLHCLDTAVGYLRLREAGWSEGQIAEAFERKRDTVMKMLRLARYPEDAKAIIRQNPEKFTSTVLLTKFVARSWKGDEGLVRAMKTFADKPARRKARINPVPQPDREVSNLTEFVSRTGLLVVGKGSRQNGQILLKWNSQTEFKVLLSLLKKTRSN